MAQVYSDLHSGSKIVFANGQVTLHGEVVSLASNYYAICALNPDTVSGERPLFYWALEYLTLE